MYLRLLPHSSYNEQLEKLQELACSSQLGVKMRLLLSTQATLPITQRHASAGASLISAPNLMHVSSEGIPTS